MTTEYNNMAAEDSQQQQEHQEQQQQQQQHAALPHKGSLASTGSRKSRSSLGNEQQRRSSITQNSPPRVVFSTTACYGPYFAVILTIPIILMMMLIVYDCYQERDEFRSFQDYWIHIWLLFFIGGLYLMIIPRHLDVRSNGTVGIKTIILTMKYDDICRAYMQGFSWKEDLCGSPRRFKFATALKPPHRIVIVRKYGKWDLVVSPNEPELFIQAIDQVVSKLERMKDGPQGMMISPSRSGDQQLRQQERPKQDMSSASEIV